MFVLERFVCAQNAVLDQVRSELGSGRKKTHWMWFVFPQLRGLGHSRTSHHFGLASLEEARAYLAHPLLGPRLLECCQLVLQVEGKTAHQIFGDPDDAKFHARMTLFATTRVLPFTFEEALRRYFGGERHPPTMALLSEAQPEGSAVRGSSPQCDSDR